MSKTEMCESHLSITVGNTLGPYRQCSGERELGWAEKLGRSIADTADSSKPLRGPMGIEWVERVGEQATQEGE